MGKEVSLVDMFLCRELTRFGAYYAYGAHVLWCILHKDLSRLSSMFETTYSKFKIIKNKSKIIAKLKCYIDL